jgi:ACR3 family arsenite efflux pump ArsB
VSLPIFIGLLVMMYPVLARVRYDRIGHVTADRRMLISSLILNWLIGPAVITALAWLAASKARAVKGAPAPATRA